ncbi:putative transcriptional regulatory protein [Smittium culicis]|uniref:Putative transcriptional regulatory protein n=1 Tax=Smittium culicis TaxID=133412 RepID=A0A1R1YAH4_9FUNG|nr:putative transcriptional regulatory protein [Smittium culicis]
MSQNNAPIKPIQPNLAPISNNNMGGNVLCISNSKTDNGLSKKILTPDLNNPSINQAKKPGHRACDSCRRRKTKCDGNKPSCGRCIRDNFKCEYCSGRARGRPPASKTKNSSSADKKRQYDENQKPEYHMIPNSNFIANLSGSRVEPSYLNGFLMNPNKDQNGLNISCVNQIIPLQGSRDLNNITSYGQSLQTYAEKNVNEGRNVKIESKIKKGIIPRRSFSIVGSQTDKNAINYGTGTNYQGYLERLGGYQQGALKGKAAPTSIYIPGYLDNVTNALTLKPAVFSAPMKLQDGYNEYFSSEMAQKQQQQQQQQQNQNQLRDMNVKVSFNYPDEQMRSMFEREQQNNAILREKRNDEYSRKFNGSTETDRSGALGNYYNSVNRDENPPFLSSESNNGYYGAKTDIFGVSDTLEQAANQFNHNLKAIDALNQRSNAHSSDQLPGSSPYVGQTNSNIEEFQGDKTNLNEFVIQNKSIEERGYLDAQKHQNDNRVSDNFQKGYISNGPNQKEDLSGNNRNSMNFDMENSTNIDLFMSVLNNEESNTGNGSFSLNSDIVSSVFGVDPTSPVENTGSIQGNSDQNIKSIQAQEEFMNNQVSFFSEIEKSLSQTDVASMDRNASGLPKLEITSVEDPNRMGNSIGNNNIGNRGISNAEFFSSPLISQSGLILGQSYNSSDLSSGNMSSAYFNSLTHSPNSSARTSNNHSQNSNQSFTTNGSYSSHNLQGNIGENFDNLSVPGMFNKRVTEGNDSPRKKQFVNNGGRDGGINNKFQGNRSFGNRVFQISNSGINSPVIGSPNSSISVRQDIYRSNTTDFDKDLSNYNSGYFSCH